MSQQLTKARNLSDKTNFFTFLLSPMFCAGNKFQCSSVQLFSKCLQQFTMELTEGKTQRLDSEHYCFR